SPICSKQNCDCPSIESVDTYKYLGVIIDKAISWKPHVDYLLGKLRFCLLIVSRLNKICSLRLLKLAYFSFFQSYFQYCIVSYGNAFDTTLLPVVTMQKKCIRLMTNESHMAASIPIFLHLKILPFKSLYIYRTLLYIKKHFNSFHLQRSRSNRNARYNHTNTIRTSRAQKCIKANSVRILNKLNCEYDITECTKHWLRSKSMEIFLQESS